MENGKNKFDSFFLLLPYFFFKNIGFPIYIFRTYHFDSKIIVSLSIAFHSIQGFSSMINDFHLLKFQISSKNTKCFKTNILTLLHQNNREGWRERGEGRGWRSDLISLNSLFSCLFTDKNLLKEAKYFSPRNKNLTSWSINNAKVH